MSKARRVPRFPHESPLGIRISARAPYNLDGDDPAQPRIPPAVDLAHATSAKETKNLVRSQKAARCKVGSRGRVCCRLLQKIGRWRLDKTARDVVAVEQRLDFASNRLIVGAGAR
jgi:hypothetical protein